MRWRKSSKYLGKNSKTLNVRGWKKWDLKCPKSPQPFLHIQGWCFNTQAGYVWIGLIFPLKGQNSSRVGFIWRRIKQASNVNALKVIPTVVQTSGQEQVRGSILLFLWDVVFEKSRFLCRRWLKMDCICNLGHPPCQSNFVNKDRKMLPVNQLLPPINGVQPDKWSRNSVWAGDNKVAK